jgi:DMSO/TMAO reductase YedYZ molybdopterin-dependent catalytic subunit
MAWSGQRLKRFDMPTGLHPQTQLTFWFDGEVLPRKYGFPMMLRIPTKLGFKNPKHIGEIEIGNEFNGGYWETHGYNVQRALNRRLARAH